MFYTKQKRRGLIAHYYVIKEDEGTLGAQLPVTHDWKIVKYSFNNLVCMFCSKFLVLSVFFEKVQSYDTQSQYAFP